MNTESRTWIRWVLAGLLVAGYLALPEGKDEPDAAAELDADADPDEGRPEIVDVSPHDAYPGNSLLLRYAGVERPDALRVLGGKRPLEIIGRPAPGTVIARIPRDMRTGDLKLRVALGEKGDPGFVRSKGHHVRIKRVNARKVFRHLAGGIGLFLLGMGLLLRGVRRATSLDAGRRFFALTRNRPLSFASGALLGVVTQSTTAAAGLLAVLSTSSVLGLSAAALAFLGAQLGAATAPVLITGLAEPRDGLLAVALGVLALALAKDRRGAAWARLLLGVGFVAYGIQLFYHGVEPTLSGSGLLAAVDGLRVSSVFDRAACALLGALLVALLQGPAPVIVIMLGVAQVTGRWDLETSLTVLAGTGLGAAGAALIAAPGSRGRSLLKLHLVLGALSTVALTLTAGVWAEVGRWFIDLSWFDQALGRRGELKLAWGLAAGFVAAQLAFFAITAPWVPALASKLSSPRMAPRARLVRGTASVDSLDVELARVFSAQRAALSQVHLLLMHGRRAAGNAAERELRKASQVLGTLAAESGEASALGREPLLWSSIGLQRSLKALLGQAEHLLDAHLARSVEEAQAVLSGRAQALVEQLHAQVSEGLDVVHAHVGRGGELDLEGALARELAINGLEAQARRGVLEAPAERPDPLHGLPLLEIADAYEVVGNQVYRVAEALSTADSPFDFASAS